MQLRRHHSPLPTCMSIQCLRFLHPFLPIPHPASIPSPATFFNIISTSHAILFVVRDFSQREKSLGWLQIFCMAGHKTRLWFPPLTGLCEKRFLFFLFPVLIGSQYLTGHMTDRRYLRSWMRPGIASLDLFPRKGPLPAF